MERPQVPERRMDQVKEDCGNTKGLLLEAKALPSFLPNPPSSLAHLFPEIAKPLRTCVMM